MKKILFSLFLSTISLSVFSQSLEGLITSFSKTENVEYTVVDSLMLRLAQSMQGAFDNDIVEKFNAVEILNLEKCSDEIKEHFRQAIKQLDNNEYMPVIDTEYLGDKIIVMQKKTDADTDLITEFVMLLSDTPLCLRIKGNFTESDIDKILQQANLK